MNRYIRFDQAWLLVLLPFGREDEEISEGVEFSDGGIKDKNTSDVTVCGI